MKGKINNKKIIENTEQKNINKARLTTINILKEMEIDNGQIINY